MHSYNYVDYTENLALGQGLFHYPENDPQVISRREMQKAQKHNYGK